MNAGYTYRGSEKGKPVADLLAAMSRRSGLLSVGTLGKVFALSVVMTLALASAALADPVTNLLDNSPDATKETVTVNEGQTTSVPLRVVALDGDGDAGCNVVRITSGQPASRINERLGLGFQSTNASVAREDPTGTSVNFQDGTDTDNIGCGPDPALSTNPPAVAPDDATLSVRGLSRGTADINVATPPVYNDTGPGTYTYTQATFTVQVNNVAPTISNITDQTTNEDTPTGNIAFTVGDAGTPAGSLTVTGSSSNTALVPDGNIAFGGSGTNRTVAVTPEPNQSGTATITVTVRDGAATTTDTFVLTVNADNDAPTISNITDQTTNEDNAVSDIPFTVGDVETSAASLTVAGSSSNTTLVPSENITFGGSDANRTITVSPAANQSGTATITVSVRDGAASSSDTFVLAVNSVNDAPGFTKGPNQTVNEDSGAQSVSGWATNISKGPADESGQGVNFEVTNDNNSLFSNQPAVSPGGTLTYTPAPNTDGTATVNAKIKDNGGTASGGVDESAVETFTITVNAVNDEPSFQLQANPDQTVAEDSGPQSVTGIVTNFSVGPSNESGQTMSYLVSNDNNGLFASQGQPSIDANGSFTYTPAAEANGYATVTVRAQDDGGTANGGDDTGAPQTFTITVNAVNDDPEANKDSYTTAEDTPLTVDVTTGVLANDSDVDGDNLTATLKTQAAYGTVVLNPNGSFTYTPGANFNGSDSFTYTISDGVGGAADGTVNVVITGVNDAPVATSDTETIAEDSGPVTINVLNNDGDDDGDTLGIGSFTQPDHGNVNCSSTSCTYTPDLNYNGPDSFTYRANDGTLDSNIATVTLDVSPVNDAPVANSDPYSVNEDNTLQIVVPGVLGNDTDVESGQLSAVQVSATAHGQLTLNANGSFTYTPSENVFGADSFTYKANDGGLDSDITTVSITVNAVNDAPKAEDDSATTDEDTPTNIAVLANDTDADADSLSVSSFTQAAHGTVSQNPNGTLRYEPNANYNGPDSFTYRANDGAADGTAATVSIAVASVNDAPTISDIPDQITNEDVPTGEIPFTVSDVESSAGALDVTRSSSNTTLVPNSNITFGGSGANRTVVVTPAPDQSGTATITVSVDDGAATTTDTFVLTVNAVDGLAPTVTKATPGGKKVSPKTRVTVTFSEAMNEISVETLGVFTLKKGAKTVSATVDYNPTTQMVTLRPTKKLLSGATYTVTMLGGDIGAKDLAGNALVANKVWKFRVR